MAENNLHPSDKLLTKYKNSSTSSDLEIPDFESLNADIGVQERVYQQLTNKINSEDEFVYCFDNNNIKVVERICELENGSKFLAISHCLKDSTHMIGAGLLIFSNGEIYQGYFKNNKKHFRGRYVPITY